MCVAVGVCVCVGGGGGGGGGGGWGGGGRVITFVYFFPYSDYCHSTACRKSIPNALFYIEFQLLQVFYVIIYRIRARPFSKVNSDREKVNSDSGVFFFFFFFSFSNKNKQIPLFNERVHFFFNI